jgi:formate dehydrogenase subunit beta
MNGLIPVQNTDVLSAVRGFLRQLMESGLVDALYVPLESGSGAIMPSLVTDPALLERANPLAPAMSINGARAVSALTGKHAPAHIGAVMRSCEIRALIELVKLQQASLEDVILIGIDCPGTYEWAEFNRVRQDGKIDLQAYLSHAARGETLELPALRPACQICTQPVPERADIHLQLFGADLDAGIPVFLGDELAEMLHIPEAAPASGRQAVLDRLIARVDLERKQEFAAMNQRLSAPDGLAEVFSTCIRCHNCSTVCPICYCKTCLFCTGSFDHAPEHYLNTAQRKGAMRLLSDTLLFQLTRLNHMSASCVSCGMCTSACPAEIPVGLLFSVIGAGVQGAFEYIPGRDLSEPLPMVTFQADEWMEVGERKR